jgi:hypothetical protein
MTTFLSQSDLAENGLKLFLSNNSGQLQDAISVRWTVFSMYTGQRVSGQSINAIKVDTGQYSAPWFSDVKTGSYKVVWEIQEDWLAPARQVSQPFFVLDPSDYRHCGPHLNQSTAPVPGSLTFLIGAYLGSNDLFVVLRDQNGFPQDAYSVMWYIQNSHGCAVTQKTFGVHTSTGVYYAPWSVAVRTGDYKIVWEFQETSTSPLQSTSQPFTVLGSAAPFMLVTDPSCSNPTIIVGYSKYCKVDARQLSGGRVYGNNPIYCTEIPLPNQPLCRPCGSRFYIQPACPPPSVPSNPSGGKCCPGGYEVSRQIHLPTGVLPAGGHYTNQNKFPVPTGIRRITFYITYTRGAVDGYAVFRLLWGNGTEEIQETLLDTDIIEEPGDNVHVGQDLFAQDLFGPAPNDNNPVSFVLYARVPGGATTVRLVAAEKGVPSTPGTVGITLTAST